MSKDWDYSQLTKAAAEAGGPAKWIKSIEKNAERKGTVNGILGCVLIIPLVLQLIKSLIKFFRRSKQQSDIKNDEYAIQKGDKSE